MKFEPDFGQREFTLGLLRLGGREFPRFRFLSRAELGLFSANDSKQGTMLGFSGANDEVVFDPLFWFARRIGLDLLETGTRVSESLFAGGNRVADDEVALIGSGRRARQIDFSNLETASESGGHAGGNEMIRIRMPLVSAMEEPRGRIGIHIEGARETIEHSVRLARDFVGADLMRLEDGADLIIFLLRDRVRHVVMALRAADRDAEERLRRVFDGVFQPLFAAEHFVVPHEKAGRAQGIGVFRGELVGSQHLGEHLVVGLVAIEGFHDPIAPAPDVRLAVANLSAVRPAGPIAVAPDIHPMACPTFAMPGIIEQAFDNYLIGIRGTVGEEGALFVRCG